MVSIDPAVDEFALWKGHHYMTIIHDLETGQILHAQEGKDAKALVPFLEKFKMKKVPLLAVTMDMSPAYLQAIRQVFPEVEIVHDPYHKLIETLNELNTVAIGC